MIAKIQVRGLSALLFTTLPLYFISGILPSPFLWRKAVLLASVVELLSFALVSTCIEASNAAFLRSFAAQTALRGGLFGAVFLLSLRDHSSLFLFGTAVTLFVLALVQIPFLLRPLHGLHRTA